MGCLNEGSPEPVHQARACEDGKPRRATGIQAHDQARHGEIKWEGNRVYEPREFRSLEQNLRDSEIKRASQTRNRDHRRRGELERNRTGVIKREIEVKH